MIVAAMAILVVGALSFVGDDDPRVAGPSPSASPLRPTAAPSRTPLATAVPVPRTPTPPFATPVASPAFSVGPGPSLGPIPTGAATPFAVQVNIGAGFVTFGGTYDRSLRILDPRARFGTSERIAWSAELSTPTNSWELLNRTFKLDLANGTEQLVDERGERSQVAAAEIVASSMRPIDRLAGPGIYVMRYVRGADVLAEGYFEVVGS